MTTEWVGQGSQTSKIESTHPLDQLSPAEIRSATAVFKASNVVDKEIIFNTITLLEPKKAELVAHLYRNGRKPARVAQLVVIERDTGAVVEAEVDLDSKQITNVSRLEGVQPLITMEDLRGTEEIIRNDPAVIAACKGLGITDMSKVYADGWTIGYDERFGSKVRLQQGMMYYRPTPDSNQYAHPLDFCPVIDTRAGKVLEIDYRRPQPGSKYERAPVPMGEHNYLPKFREEFGGYRTDMRPISTTQPKGVSFEMKGNEISWLGWKMHIGFNYREGIVLNNVRYNDNGTERPIFWRMSIAEMVVPYGEPYRPSTRKMALDVGEYGIGMMSNSLKLGCDCKGAIHYLNGVVSSHSGAPEVIQNAVCIHEEDAGLLHKHMDFRDTSTIATRGRKLLISQVFTAANYEYCIYWQFYQDGTIQPELKLTGMLNTFVLAPDEQAAPWGTEVAPQVTAHNHQHIFSVRLNPMVDGENNTVVQSDAVSSEAPLGSPENYYGNAFYAKKTVYKTTDDGQANYEHSTARSWDIISSSKIHPYAKKPTCYKIISREAIQMLAKPGSIVWKRAPFARKNIWVTPYVDGQLYPAGKFVPQTDGSPNVANETLLDWMKGSKNIQNTDIVVWLTFGLTHFPRTEGILSW